MGLVPSPSLSPSLSSFLQSLQHPAQEHFFLLQSLQFWPWRFSPQLLVQVGMAEEMLVKLVLLLSLMLGGKVSLGFGVEMT